MAPVFTYWNRSRLRCARKHSLYSTRVRFLPLVPQSSSRSCLGWDRSGSDIWFDAKSADRLSRGCCHCHALDSRLRHTSSGSSVVARRARGRLGPLELYPGDIDNRRRPVDCGGRRVRSGFCPSRQLREVVLLDACGPGEPYLGKPTMVPAAANIKRSCGCRAHSVVVAAMGTLDRPPPASTHPSHTSVTHRKENV